MWHSIEKCNYCHRNNWSKFFFSFMYFSSEFRLLCVWWQLGRSWNETDIFFSNLFRNPFEILRNSVKIFFVISCHVYCLGVWIPVPTISFYFADKRKNAITRAILLPEAGAEIVAQWRCGLILVIGEVFVGPSSRIPTKMWADVLSTDSKIIVGEVSARQMTAFSRMSKKRFPAQKEHHPPRAVSIIVCLRIREVFIVTTHFLSAGWQVVIDQSTNHPVQIRSIVALNC